MSPLLCESDILAALASYREHIGHLNHRALSAMVPAVQAAGLNDDEPGDDEPPTKARLDFILRVVGAGDGGRDVRPPGIITSPSDVLTHWATLAPQLSLDGASVYGDAAWRDEIRGRYVQGVLRGLNERCRSELVTTWEEFPADLAVVLRQVDSLEGPGWHKWRYERESLVFLEGWVRDTSRQQTYDPYTEEEFAALVRTPEEIAQWTTEFAEEYEIAGGWQCSETGNEATCYVVYSRARTDAAAGEEERRGWSWRYVASLGQYGEQWFEDMVGLLAWYKSYGEPREEDWSVTAEEVFSAC
ncbi:hypothetical protein PG984_005389 [Apiospora sp. TS-2023a]